MRGSETIGKGFSLLCLSYQKRTDLGEQDTREEKDAKSIQIKLGLAHSLLFSLFKRLFDSMIFFS
jgi:hypothetical protein